MLPFHLGIFPTNAVLSHNVTSKIENDWYLKENNLYKAITRQNKLHLFANIET